MSARGRLAVVAAIGMVATFSFGVGSSVAGATSGRGGHHASGAAAARNNRTGTRAPLRTQAPKRTATTGAWTVEQGIVDNGYFWLGASCTPGTTTCFISGSSFGQTGFIAKSTDGGATWSNQTPNVPTSAGGLKAISCPTTSSCIAGGASSHQNATTTPVPGILATANGGASWAAQTLPASVVSDQIVTGVSCANASDCIAVGNLGAARGPSNASFIVATTDGGATWAEQTSATTNSLGGVSCASATTCFAVGGSGAIIATTDGGTTWAAQTSGTTNNLHSVSCPTTSDCTAVGAGGTILATTDGGTTWAAQTSGTTNNLYSVSCTDSSHCVVAGAAGTVLYTTNGGSLWGAGTSGVTVDVNGVSCYSTSGCVAVTAQRDKVSAAAALYSTDGGSTWSRVVPVQPIRRVGYYGSNGLSCVGTTTCFAASSSGPYDGGSFGIIQRTVDGVHWSRVYNGAASSGPLHGISCSDASHCVAVGGGNSFNIANRTALVASVLVTADGGASWVSEPSPGAHVLNGVDCTSTSNCVAVGESGTILTTTDGGAAWTAQTSGSTNSLRGISCPDASDCFVASTGTAVLVSNDGGTTWTSHTTPNSVTGINCPDSSHCFAVDNTTVDATTDGGTTWTSTTISDPNIRDIWNIYCSSDTTCIASGGTGFTQNDHPALILTTTDAWATWNQETTPLGTHGTPNVSCTATACWAAGGKGGIISNFLPPPGYWLAGADGGVFNFGQLGYYGSLGNKTLNAPIVGITGTKTLAGYWLAGSDGGVFNFGDANYYGSKGGQALNKPVVGIAGTANDGGYWLAAGDGGIFNFGDAAFYGSLGNRTLNAPIVGIASTSDGGGYWLVASDGGVFNFGDAPYKGSLPGLGIKPNKPIVGIAGTDDHGGYWLVASDGGVFNFGDAPFEGSTGNRTLNSPIVGMIGAPGNLGYWLAAADGGIFNFGDATYQGSLPGLGIKPNKPIVGIAGG